MDLPTSFDLLSSAMVRSVFYGLLIQRDGQIIFANDKAARMVGLQRGDDLVGKLVFRYVDRRDMVSLRDKLNQGKNSHVVLGECRLSRSDGASFSVDVEIIPFLCEEPDASLVIFRDVSMRKGIEHSYWESEKKYWELFNALSDGVLVHEVGSGVSVGKVREVNDALCLMLGYSRSELCSLNVISLIDPSSQDMAKDLYRDLMGKGEIVSRLSMSRKDGRPIPVEVSVRVVSLWDRPIALGIIRDLSSLSALKGEVDSLERRYRAFFSNLSDPFVLYQAIWDDGGHPWRYRFSEANQPYLDLLGLDRSDVIGRNVLDVVQDGDLLMLSSCEEVLTSGEPLRFVHHSKLRDSFWNVSVFSPDKGYVAVVLCDISASKKLEVQVERFERLQSLGQIAAGVAHDFSNHLVGIMSYGATISRDSSDPSARVMASRIMDIAFRANDLVKRLLVVSQKGDIAFEPVNLHDIITEVADITAFGWDGSISIRLLLGSPSLEIKGNGSQIYNAITNLMINARDSMPDGGTITISTDLAYLDQDSPPILGDPPVGYYVKVSVSDSGRGIAPRDLPRIFDPFFSTKPQGTGMGLPMVFATVQAHGGGIEVHSSIRRGTVFSLYFPIEGTVSVMSDGDISSPSDNGLDKGDMDGSDLLDRLGRELELHRPKGVEDVLSMISDSDLLEVETLEKMRGLARDYLFESALDELKRSR